MIFILYFHFIKTYRDACHFQKLTIPVNPFLTLFLIDLFQEKCSQNRKDSKKHATFPVSTMAASLLTRFGLLRRCNSSISQISNIGRRSLATTVFEDNDEFQLKYLDGESEGKIIMKNRAQSSTVHLVKIAFMISHVVYAQIYLS